MINTKKITRRHRLTVLLGSLLLITISSSLLFLPPAAHAQVASDVIGGPSQIISTVFDKIADAAKWAWDNLGAEAYKNAIRTFTQQIAYNTAIMLTSGGQGQGPLVETKSFGQIVKDAADSAAGDFLDTLDTQNPYINLGVCRPQGPGGASFQLIIGYSLFNEVKPRQPRCTLSEIRNNWEKFLADPKNILERFNVVFDPRQNDLGIALELHQTLIKDKEGKAELAKATAQTNEGFKAITEPITRLIKTPAAQIKQLSNVQIDLGLGTFGDYTGNAIADALGVFTNTLAARLMRRLQQGTVPNPSRLTTTQFGFGPQGGVEYAIQVNSSISTPQLVGKNDAVDIISELVNCPADPAFYTPVNACTITQRFAQALRKADEGSPLTIQEAINQGFIDGGLRFALVRASDDLRAPTKAWYLSDLRKLRRARIIPLGWEIAAQMYAGTSVTLQQVIGTPPDYTDGFNGAGPDGVCGTGDDAMVNGNSVCGLIDPNWVLRAPPAQCRIQAYGQQLETQQGPSRQKTCVDFQHCVVEKDDGTCQAWGYCKREQNIWRFSGQSCEFPEGSGASPWGTCQSFVSATGATVSYLTNSLANYDDGICTDAATCRWYSAARNPADDLSKTDDNYLVTGTQANVNTVDFSHASATALPRFYLKNVLNKACSSKEEGCTTFLQLKNINTEALGISADAPLAEQVRAAVARVTASTSDNYGQYAAVTQSVLRQAPPYLNCYDFDLNGLPNKANDAPECSNYLALCSENEVGCELYTPQDGSPAVPGRVAPANTCPAECKGFNTYTQVSAFFENYTLRGETEPSLNFIPTTAKTCSAANVGCEEFTNVEKNETKEYYSELRQCVRPEDNKHNTYYTWVGSDLTGYQLKTWQLEAVNPGDPLSAPVTTDASGDCSGSHNPDCKEFYATDGSRIEVHYRLESKVRYASANCNRYRATSITQADCDVSGGSWEGGFCYYRAIPAQGKACSSAAVGCREFRGPTAGNVRLVFPISTFGDREPGVTADASPLSGWNGGTNSTESTSAFGHSLASGDDRIITKDISGLVTQGKQYILTFWAKQDTTTIGSQSGLSLPLAKLFGVRQAEAQMFTWDLGSFTPTSEWAIYSLGPTTLTNNVSAGVILRITGTSKYFIDNIAFREVQDTFFVRKNTWVTPATCLAPQHLRCSAYNTRDRQTAYLTGFSGICRNEAIGCQALVDTHNSSDPRELTVTAGDQTIVVPADEVVYRVYDTKKSCAVQFAGCKRLGQPNFSANGRVASWTDIFTVLNPDTFDPTVNHPNSPLCGSTQNRCQAYKDAKAVTHYFKDPLGQTCEYKIISSSGGYDWYKVGTGERCNLVANPSFELLSSGTVGDGNADTFVGWSQVSSSATNYLEAIPSLNGTYWGSNILRLSPLSGGVKSADITFSASSPPDRLFAAYARVYVPAATTISGNLSLNVTCTPACTGTNLLGGTFAYNNATLTSLGLKDKWVLLSRVVRAPAVTSLAVSLNINSANVGDVYADQVQVIELDASLTNAQAIEQAEVPYAYLCPSNQAGCTAYHDPELSKKTYYYLNDDRLDKGLCNGQVSEKEGCLLFNNLSEPRVSWSAGLTYAKSRAQGNKYVSPVGTDTALAGFCSNNSTRSCNVDSDCADTCVAVSGQSVCSNNPTQTCSTAADCTTGVPQCRTNVGVCEGDRSRICQTDDDCRGLITQSNKKTFSIAIPVCYATQAECQNAGGGSVCNYCQVDLNTCGANVPYLCNSRANDAGRCIDRNENRCADNPENLCDPADQLSCANPRPTCAPLTTRHCTNNPSQSCSTNADCSGICLTASATTLDTNTILKVRRDRTCAEWLSCKSESPRFNPQTNRYDSICYALGACNQLGSTEQSSNRCAAWLTPPAQPKPLNKQQYQERARESGSGFVDWADRDYSGYSLPDIYPLEVLVQKEYGRLRCGGKPTGAVCANPGSADPPCSQSDKCAFASDIRLTYLNTNRKTCGGVINGTACATLGNVCSDGTVCQYEDLGLTGTGSGAIDSFENTKPKLCRAYPQADAPFPADVALFDKACSGDDCGSVPLERQIDIPKSKASGFKDANICQKGEDCECSYQQAAYSFGDNLFYGLGASPIPAYTTEKTSNEGSAPTEVINRLKRNNVNIGLKGYCLEKDPSRLINAGSALDQACLTWLPIDVVGGEVSLYDYSPEAGYQGGESYYCSAARGNFNTDANKYVAFGFNGSRINNTWGDTGITCYERMEEQNWNGCDVGQPNGALCISKAQNTDPYAIACGQFSGGEPIGPFDWYITAGSAVNNAGGLGAIEAVKLNVTVIDTNGRGRRHDYEIILTRSAPARDVISFGHENYRYFYTVNFNDPIHFIRFQTKNIHTDGATHIYIIPTYLTRELCSEVVKAATVTTNKAWSDRVLRTNYTAQPNNQLGFTSARNRAPFGKFSLQPQGRQSLVIADDYMNVPNYDYVTVTTPFSCVNGPCGGNTTGASTGMCISPPSKVGDSCSKSKDCNDPSGTNNGVCTGYFSGICSNNSNLSCIKDSDCGGGGNCTNYRSMGPIGLPIGRERVRQIFAAEYGVYSLNNTNGMWEDTSTAGLKDISCGLTTGCTSGPGEEGALVTKTCRGGSNNGNACTSHSQCSGSSAVPPVCAGVPAAPIVRPVLFSQQNQVLGEVATTGFTVMANSQPRLTGDVSINSSDAVSVMFYAYNPNGEQMPLRKVFVDWGDNSTLSGALGSYKNRKHDCKASADAGYNWGDDPRACVEDAGASAGYFTYTHVYTCTGPNSAGWNATTGKCTLKPRVFVEDNWQWCARDGWKCNGDSADTPNITGRGWVEYPNNIIVNPVIISGGGSPGPLTVSPSSIINSCGKAGGPFSPSSQTYTLTNAGSATLSWIATDNQTWLDVIPASGTLGPGASTTVTALLNTNANSLPPNTHTAIITFSNSANNPAPFSRAISLRVVPTGQTCSASVSD